MGLLLHDDRATGRAVAMRDIADAELHQITGSELTVDGEIEHRELPDPRCELQADADGPDVLDDAPDAKRRGGSSDRRRRL